MIDILTLAYFMVFIPLICAVVLLSLKLLPLKLPQKICDCANSALSMLASFLTLGISLLLFEYTLTYQGYVLENNYPVCAMQNILLYFGIYTDNLSGIFIVLLSLFFFIANIFSFRYLLQNRQGFARFYIYLNFMQFFTYCFFASSNLIQSVVFMMAQSLMLYLFANFYFQKPLSQENSKKVFETNIAADLILFGASVAFLYFSTIATDTINAPTLGFNNINSLGLYSFASLNPLIFALICLLFIIGAVIKSAQYPFSICANGNSQAPNPVFSIIISLIVPGQAIFLLLRIFPLLNLTPALFEILKIAGIITALTAALSAAKENDIKQICADLAVSQAGISLFILGFKMYDVCIFYFLCAAFGVALVSYTLNTVSYSTGSQENIKFLGGLREKLPFLTCAYLAGAISLCGFVFSGFYPKAILLGNLSHAGKTIYLTLNLICSFVTAFYLFRVYFRVFEGNYRGTIEPKRASRTMIAAILILLLPCIFFGFIFYNKAGAFFTLSGRANLGGSNPFMNVLAFLISAAGYYLAYNIYFTKRLHSLRIRPLRRLAARRFFADDIRDFIFRDFILFVYRIFAFFEKYVLAFFYAIPAFLSAVISFIVQKTQSADLNSRFFKALIWIFLITLFTCLIYFKTGVVR